MFRLGGLTRILPGAIVALALILSIGAVGFHRISHGLDQIAGAAAPAGHKHAPDPYGSHDHFEGASHPVAALPRGTELAPPPLAAVAPPAARTRTLAFRLGDPPLPDPPRTA